MVGLGTLFIGLMAFAVFQLIRKKLYETKWVLWLLLFFIPFPYIANTTGWYTAELGRQPWLVYNLVYGTPIEFNMHELYVYTIAFFCVFLVLFMIAFKINSSRLDGKFAIFLIFIYTIFLIQIPIR